MTQAGLTLSDDSVINASVNGRIIVRLLLIRGIPEFSDRLVNALAEGTASSQDSNQIVSLALDQTKLMNCPAEGDCCRGGNCCYLYSEDTNPALLPSFCKTDGVRKVSKFDKAKEAVNGFISTSLDSSDQVALVAFSEDAVVEQEMTFATDANKKKIISKINALKGIRGTNIHEGLMSENEQFAGSKRQAGIKYNETLILLTDGAPTYDKSIENGKETDLSCVLDSTFDPVIMDSGQVCSDSGRPITDGRVCYLRALSLSDQIRKQLHGISIFAVGFGTPSTIINDPYQDYREADPLKNFFMRRLANTNQTEIVENGEIVVKPPAQLADPDFDCVKSYLDYNSPYGYTNAEEVPEAGRYLEAKTGDDLVSLFKKLVVKKSPRLIQ